MPGMLRPLGKAKNIAYKILGEPANIKSKKTKLQLMIDRRLLWDETSRVR
jgi:hypothetical protein